jgi:hypothetical protein
MRRAILAACVGWGLLCWGDVSAGAAKRASASDMDKALKRRVDRYAVSGPLAAAFVDFADTAGVKLRVDWAGLERTGVRKDQRVSIEVEKVNCRQALEVLLAKAGRSGHPLGWRIDEDGVLISTHRRILLLKQGEQRAAARIGRRLAGARPAKKPARRAPNLLPKVRFNEMPFRDVLRFFQTVTGANFHVNWQAIKQQGIDPDTPVSLDVRRISIARAMDLTMDQVNAGRDKLESVYWVIDRGVVLISTGNALNRRVVTRVFDAASALMIAPDSPGPRISLETSDTNVNSSSYRSEGIFDDADQQRDSRREEESFEEKRKKRRDQLVRVIKSMIGEDMWQPEGKGSITLVGNKLVISQTLLGFKLMEKSLR